MFDDQPTVVVGIDGAIDCEQAIRWATTEAATRHAPLRLVHAFVWSEFQVPLGPTDLAPGLRIQAGRIVAGAVEAVEKFDRSVAVTAAQVDGFPSRVLLAESVNADLVVLGSRELGRVTGLVVSATGRQLTAQAHCPVVVVRPTTVLTGSHVVIGYDGSAASAAAVEFGLAHAERHGLTARIVAVHEPGHDVPVLPEHLDATRLEVVELTGPPAELLLQWSADAQLLVVGSRGRGGFSGLLLGSISQTMLHQASCPVAVIPPAAIESPAVPGRSALPVLARH